MGWALVRSTGGEVYDDAGIGNRLGLGGPSKPCASNSFEVATLAFIFFLRFFVCGRYIIRGTILSFPNAFFLLGSRSDD